MIQTYRMPRRTPCVSELRSFMKRVDINRDRPAEAQNLSRMLCVRCSGFRVSDERPTSHVYRTTPHPYALDVRVAWLCFIASWAISRLFCYETSLIVSGRLTFSQRRASQMTQPPCNMIYPRVQPQLEPHSASDSLWLHHRKSEAVYSEEGYQLPGVFLLDVPNSALSLPANAYPY